MQDLADVALDESQGRGASQAEVPASPTRIRLLDSQGRSASGGWRGPTLGLLLALVVVPPAGAGGKKPPGPPPLTLEHLHPSGAFSFRTPAGWTLEPSRADPRVLEAAGDGILVRFLYQDREAGFDSLHATCMMERLAPHMETEPRVKYEYDFVGGVVGNRRALDSAFSVRYDAAVLGHRDWRQRNLTIVGDGESLCVISYVALPVWKRSRETHAVLDAVLRSLSFR